MIARRNVAGGAKLRRCVRCGRRMRNPNACGDWNIDVRGGEIVAVICPACQTPAEHVEAEINLATLDYGMLVDGRLIGRAKHGFGGGVGG